MGLSTMIKKIKKERNELKLLILGLDNSGKTTILHRQLGTRLDDIPPTFGYQIHSVSYGSRNLLFLDIGGQSVFRKYWSNYYEKLDGLIYVFDLTDPRPYEALLEDIINDPFLADVPILVLGNKCDLCEDVTAAGELFARSLKVSPHVNLKICSAMTGEGVNEGFEWLITRA